MTVPLSAPHQATWKALYAETHSRPLGLTRTEAAARLQTEGRNVLWVKPRTSPFRLFVRQFRNFFALLLVIGGLLALLGERFDPGNGNGYIALALFSVVFLNALFGFVQEFQSDRILASFEQLLARTATVLRDGTPTTVPARDVVVGDVLLVVPGEGVSADARLIEQHNLKIDLSSLTGESEPSLRHLECTHPHLLESRNMIFSGTLVQSGSGKALVYATGMDTEIGKIVRLTKETDEVDAPIRRELEHFVRSISAIAVGLGVVFFLLGSLTGKGVLVSLLFGIGIIVANVPEGLLPTVTLALTLTSKRMARRNALVRHLESVETLGCATVICTDKTGTLTQNRMRVTTVLLDEQEYSGWDLELRRSPTFESLQAVEILCNNATRATSGYRGDPTEIALLLHAYEGDVAPDLGLYERVGEEPFDSQSKRMITFHRIGERRFRSSLKGAPEVVMERCDRVLLRGVPQILSSEVRDELTQRYLRLARRGERVLALAHWEGEQDTIPEGGYILSGVIGMTDPPRPEVESAIARTRTAGIRVIMITGDHALTGEAIARQVGLVRGPAHIVTGEELSQMSEEVLHRTLDASELIFARTTPAQKLRVVQALQGKGEIVVVTGDGVNDAPALKNADMGVAMGSGTDVAREAAKMVLLDDNFATIVRAIEEGRTIYANIRKFISYILTSNVPEILPFIAFVLLDIPLPLTVVLILAIDLGTDILPALGLGAEPPEADVMDQPPRPRKERLLTPKLLLRSYGVVGMVEASAGFFAFFFVLLGGGWQYGQSLTRDDLLYRTAVTAFFASVVICQIANVLICRTAHASLWSTGLFQNRLLVVGILSEVALLSVLSYLPFCHRVLATAPLAPWHYLLGLPFAAFMLLGDEFRRRLLRQKTPFALHYLNW